MPWQAGDTLSVPVWRQAVQKDGREVVPKLKAGMNTWTKHKVVEVVLRMNTPSGVKDREETGNKDSHVEFQTNCWN